MSWNTHGHKFGSSITIIKQKTVCFVGSGVIV